MRKLTPSIKNQTRIEFSKQVEYVYRHFNKIKTSQETAAYDGTFGIN